MATRHHLSLAWLVLVQAGCFPERVYRCEASAECDTGGGPGVCQPTTAS